MGERHRYAAGAAVMLAGALALGPDLGSAQSTNAWPTFHGSAMRTGASNVAGTLTRQVGNRWDLPKAVEGSPAIGGDGTAYIGDDDGKVYALSPSQGTGPKWSFATKGPVVAAPTISSDGQTLYVASQDGFVYALNTSDGKQKWAASLAGTLLASPLLSTDGTLLYEPVPFGSFKTLNTSDGSLVKSTAINGTIPGSMAASPDGATVYVATTNNYMYGASAPTASGGGQLSAFYLDGEALATPAVDANGNLYVSTNQGSLDSFTPSNSAPRWIFNTASRTPSNSSPAFYNGTVFFGSGDQNLYAINATSGSQIWQAHTGGNISSSPAVSAANGEVYVGSEDGNVYALNAASGALTWVYQTGAAVVSSPGLAPDGSVWVGSTSGSVFRFQSSSPPPAPSTTPGKATSVPTTAPTAAATATSVPGTTPVVTPTPTFKFTLKAKVKPGNKQSIKVTTKSRAVMRFRVNYPNGDHQSHRGKANAKGVLTYTYTQGASKIKHNQQNATVIVTNAAGVSVSKKYTIQFGKIDVSAEPRTQAVGKTVRLWIHTSARTRVVAVLLFPTGRLQSIAARTGSNGWANPTYKVGRNLKSHGKNKVTVLARLVSKSSVSTKTSFTIK